MLSSRVETEERCKQSLDFPLPILYVHPLFSDSPSTRHPSNPFTREYLLDQQNLIFINVARLYYSVNLSLLSDAFNIILR